MAKELIKAFQYEVQVGSTDIGSDEDRLRGLVSLMTREEAEQSLRWWLRDTMRRVRLFKRIDAPKVVIEETEALRDGEIANLLRERLEEAEL